MKVNMGFWRMVACGSLQVMLMCPAVHAGVTIPAADWQRWCTGLGVGHRQDTGNFGTSMAFADVNGDGCDDLFVGGPNYEEGPVSQPEEGKVVVFPGSTNGLSSTPIWHTRAVSDSGDHKGHRIAVGDVNGDGRPDLVEQGSDYLQIFRGGLRLYTNCYQNIPTTSAGALPAWDAFGAGTMNGRPIMLADLNGDGRDDIVAETDIYYTDPSTGLPPTNPSGDMMKPYLPSAVLLVPALTTANVNGDAYADIVTELGVYLGGPTGIANPGGFPPNVVSPAKVITACSAGDVDGDGYEDVLFGYGPVELYFGGPTGLSDASKRALTFPGPLAPDDAYLGITMCAAGRFDADVYGDIVLGDPQTSATTASGNGYFQVFYGRSDAKTAGMNRDPMRYYLWDPSDTETAGSNSPGDFASALAAGRVHGDLGSDIAVGARSEGYFDAAGNYTGYAYAFYGAAITAQPAPDADGDGIPDAWETQYGGTNLFSNAGDFDGDGMSDDDEYIAGTVPTNATSRLIITGVSLAQGNDEHVLRWPSVTNRLYSIWHTTNLLEGFTMEVTNGLPAYPPSNVHTVRSDSAAIHYYRTGVQLIGP